MEKKWKVTWQAKNALKWISQKGQHNGFKFGEGNEKWTDFKK